MSEADSWAHFVGWTPSSVLDASSSRAAVTVQVNNRSAFFVMVLNGISRRRDSSHHRAPLGTRLTVASLTSKTYWVFMMVCRKVPQGPLARTPANGSGRSQNPRTRALGVSRILPCIRIARSTTLIRFTSARGRFAGSSAWVPSLRATQSRATGHAPHKGSRGRHTSAPNSINA